MGGGGEGARKEDAAVFRNSFELQTAAVPRDKGGKQRSGDGQEAIVDYYQLQLHNMRLSHSPHPSTQRTPPSISSKNEHFRAPGKTKQMLPKLSLILIGTETEVSEGD